MKRIKLLATNIFVLLFLITTNVEALTPRERSLLEAAGEYYGAILFANEFKKTRCGNINIDQKWTDIMRARREIREKIPANLRNELDKDWSVFENEARRGVGDLIASINSPKYQNVECAKIQAVFWQSFDKAVTGWRSY
jgi:hypothetical protein